MITHAHRRSFWPLWGPRFRLLLDPAEWARDEAAWRQENRDIMLGTRPESVTTRERTDSLSIVFRNRLRVGFTWLQLAALIIGGIAMIEGFHRVVWCLVLGGVSAVLLVLDLFLRIPAEPIEITADTRSIRVVRLKSRPLEESLLPVDEFLRVYVSNEHYLVFDYKGELLVFRPLGCSARWIRERLFDYVNERRMLELLEHP
jgi:hypothetical protein